MLKRVEIKGFRSCQDVVLDDLGGLTALIGRNAAGKTTILKAIEWIARSATAPEFDRHGIAHDSWRTLSGSLQIALGNEEFHYTFRQASEESNRLKVGLLPAFEFIKYRSGAETWSPLIERKATSVVLPNGEETRHLGVGLYHPSLYAVTTFLPPDDPLLTRVKPLIDFLKATRYYALDEPNESKEPQIFSEENYQAWLSDYRATGEIGPSVSMRLLHLAREEQKSFADLKSLLGGDGLGIIDDIKVVSIASTLLEILLQQGQRSGGGNVFLPYAKLSLGTRRVLNIMISYVFDQSPMMLIEHPEDGIHFGLARKLIHWLRSGSDHVQTILTSHSPDVLNVLKPGDIRLIALKNGATQVRPLTDVEMKAAANYIKEEGALSDFLRIVEED